MMRFVRKLLETSSGRVAMLSLGMALALGLGLGTASPISGAVPPGQRSDLPPEMIWKIYPGGVSPDPEGDAAVLPPMYWEPTDPVIWLDWYTEGCLLYGNMTPQQLAELYSGGQQWLPGQPPAFQYP